MTTETIIPVYVPSYIETAPTYLLSVTSAGVVGSGGVTTNTGGVYTVVNSGRIGTPATDTGVQIYRGGTVINDLGATIAAGGIGVSIGTGYESRGTHTSFGSVVNDGTILAGTGAGLYLGDNLLQGAFVTNGGTGDTTALISGADGIFDPVGLFAGVDTTIRNFGTIRGTGGSGDAGVVLDQGTRATIVNGSSLDSHALITGFIGIDGAGDGDMVVQNFGTIEGSGGEAVLLGSPSDTLIVEAGATFIGAVDGAGGTLVLAADAGAGTLTGLGTSFANFNNVSVASGAVWTLTGVNSIAAGTVVTNDGALRDAGTLINSGSIEVAHYRALQISPGGSLYNAVGGDIVGSGPGSAFAPVVFGATGGDSTIRNLGTIRNVGGDVGVYLAAGGTITNGSASDTTALLYGALPIYVNAGRGTVTNFGTIETRPIGGGPGMELNQGGIVVNGASNSTAASILGVQYGVFAVAGPTTLTNFGTIVSYSGYGFDQRYGAATVFNAGVIGAINGSGVGIELEDGGTIIDSGTVEGANTAVRFGGSGSNLLVLEHGYAFFGLIQGSASASNTLELVGSVGAAVTVKYLDLGVGLVNFQTVEFGPGAGNYATLGISNDSELPGTIAGFIGVHDTVDLTTLSDIRNDATTSFNAATDVLTVTGDNGSVQLQLGSGDYADINWVAQDDGNGGTAIHAVDDPPVVTAGATADFTGGGAPAVLDSVLTISDPSRSTLVSATVSISAGFVFGDMLDFTNRNNITGSYNTTTGVLTLSGTASIADYQAALESITYGFSPSDGNPTGTDADTTRTVSWTVNDGTNSSTVATSTLDTTHVAPTIAASGNVVYTIDGSAVTLDPTVSVADVDSSGNLVGAEVVVTGGTFAGDGDQLVVNLAGTGITATYDSANETLILAGTATLGEYEAVLSTVAFSSSGSNPTDGGSDPSRTISWTVNDGAAVSSVATTTVGFSSVPPVIAGTVAGQTTTDESAVTPFSGVSISDVDFGQTETVTVTLSSPANGTLSNLDGGSYDSATGVYSVTGTDAAVSAAVDGLVFTPTAHQVAPGDTVTTTFTIQTTDNAGGTTSNSTTTVSTAAVDDPPVITGTVAGQLMSDDQTERPFSGVTISDPDVGAIETVTITLDLDGVPSDANGTLSGAGLTKTAPGIYTLTAGSPAAVTAALQALVFTPTLLDLPPGSSAVTDMTLSVSDGTANPPTTDTTTSVAIVPCFAAGTRISTPRGPIPVERLREGNTVLTVSGKPRRIQWIGCRTLDCNRHMSPERVKPIRVAPHAFGENRPRRALLLSPDHSVYVEDVLIPIRHLVNGTTVTQIDVATVTYYHIELPSHDVVLAEGLPAETYLETGARFAFENGGGAMQLHPDFAPDEARVGMVWQNFSYASLIGTDGQLERVRARLALQALMLGHQASDTSYRQKKRARQS